MSLTRRSFFGVVVAGASALVLPRTKPKVRVMDVPFSITVTHATDEQIEELRRRWAEAVRSFNDHSSYMNAFLPGVERIDIVPAGPYSGPSIIRLEDQHVRVS